MLRQSYNARQKHRLAQGFETQEEAAERTRTSPPQKRNRSHTPATNNIEGDLEQLLRDVQSWPETTVNWSEKARDYNIRVKGADQVPKNGGQIVKSILTAKGADLARFQADDGIMQQNVQGTSSIQYPKIIP